MFYETGQDERFRRYSLCFKVYKEEAHCGQQAAGAHLFRKKHPPANQFKLHRQVSVNAHKIHIWD